MFKKKKFSEKNLIKNKFEILKSNKKINLFDLRKVMYLHTGENFIEKKFFFFDLGYNTSNYFLTKKPFSPSINKIIKKK